MKISELSEVEMPIVPAYSCDKCTRVISHLPYFWEIQLECISDVCDDDHDFDRKRGVLCHDCYEAVMTFILPWFYRDSGEVHIERKKKKRRKKRNSI